MPELSATASVTLFVGVHVFGFCTAWLARMSIGQQLQWICQAMFYVAFCLVGLATMQAFALGTTAWLASGFTLGSMVLITVCDFSHHRRVTLF